jgi:fatty acid desaturase
MRKFIQIFQDKDSKISAKRFWGGVILFLCGVAFSLDGLGFYTVSTTLFNSFLFAGTSLVGLDTIKHFKK